MLLEVLLGGSDELDGDELVTVKLSVHATTARVPRLYVPSLLEAADDLADDAALCRIVNIQALPYIV